MAELRGLGGVSDELKKRNGRLLAISVDPQAESRKVVKNLGLDFALLADIDRQVITSYGLVHPGGGMDGSDIAVPAHLLIESSGNIAWRYKAKLIQARPDPQDVLRAIAALN